MLFNKLEHHYLEKVNLHFRTLNNPFCLQLLNFIYENEISTVTKICQHFNKSQSYISQQLARLRRLKIICFKKDKKNIYYSINKPVLEKFRQFVIELNQL